MKAELRRLHSPDADLTRGHLPDEPLFVQLMIGPEGGLGEESFDVMVCTPRSRHQAIDPSDPDSEKYLLVVERMDADVIAGHVRDYLRDLDGATWRDLALQIGTLGRWEFEDYRP
ncbi:MAG: hypothetical protein J2P17_07630 [Mycobacterium sp.]|nr:hypothetical protein [Mycobacterium sp.]